MAAAPDKRETEITFNQRLGDFIQKNRRALFIGLLAVVIALIGLIIFVTVRDRLQASALSQFDDFSRRHSALRVAEPGEGLDLITHAMEMVSLIDELNAFASRTSGFAAARAFNLIAEIHWDQQNWPAAERAWLEVARVASRTYLAPIALFNAAVAAEEQGNIDSAITHLTRAAAMGDVFPSAPRAQFSIGRLEEKRNNPDAAIAAYRRLLSQWPNEPVWANLAQNRILYLSE